MSQIPSSPQPGVPAVTNDRVADDAVILDVRNDDEWVAGHAPNAVHIPLPELESRLDEVPSDAGLAVTCRGGGRSSRAVAYLTAQGRDVRNLEGGMKGWEATGRPLVSESGDAPHVL